MTDDALVIEALEAREKRREERRDFFRTMGRASAAFAGAMALGVGGRPAFAQAAPTEADVFNFALNLEYLEAQFYTFASFGSGLPDDLLGGTGTRGQVQGGRAVNFTDPQVARYAREIAIDERNHVEFIRTTLGASAVAQPTIDIRGNDPTSAFSTAALAAGLINPGETFDPYASDENFLLAAFIFEDVGVTAYKGASPLLINNDAFVEAAAGILAVEAYHAGLIRTVLYRKGVDTPALGLIEATEQISDARDTLDGPDDRDQGIAPIGNASNIAPLDNNGIAFSRDAADVLNIVYLNDAAVTEGGFFPDGVNGTINMSDAA